MQDNRHGRSAFSWGGALVPPEEDEERPRRAQSNMDNDDKASPLVTLTRCPHDATSLSLSGVFHFQARINQFITPI